MKRFIAVLLALAAWTAHANPTLVVTAVNPTPVLMNGPPGSWDSVDVMNPSVMYTQGVMANYYSGWNGTIWQTGIAVSDDNGATWWKESVPVITPGTGGWASHYIAANGSTLTFNGVVMTFYMGQTDNAISQIGLATALPPSQMNLTLQPAPVLPYGNPGDADERGAGDPFVMQTKNYLTMYYLGVSDNWTFAIMQAISFDGVTWLKNKTPVLTMDPTNGNEAGGIGEPDVFTYCGVYYMIYTGDTPGHYRSLLYATSTDGANWTKQGLLLPANLRPTFASQVMADPSVVPTGTPGQFSVYYGGGNIPQGSENLNGRIGVLTIQVSQ